MKIGFNWIPFANWTRARRQAWQRSLEAVRLDLLELAKQTESEFLAVGDHLQDFFTKSNQTASESANIIEAIETKTSPLIQSLQQQFEHAYNEVETYLSQVREIESGVANLDSKLEEISNFRESLDSLARQLTFLAVSMKIEVGRVRQNEFNVVVKTVDTLVGQIKQIQDSVVVLTDNAHGSLVQVKQTLQESFSSFNVDIQAGKEGIFDVLRQIESRNLETLQYCRTIQDLSQQNFNPMQQIVIALQTHDICRQQMEHVSEALEEINVKFHRGGASDTDKKVVSSWISKVLAIQNAQLDGVIEQMDETASEVKTNLQSILDSVVQQTQSALYIQQKQEANIPEIERLGEELNQLGKVLSSTEQLTKEAVAAITPLNEYIQEVFEQLEEILSIRDELDHLAINAVIKAAHTGDHGTVLGVLSQKIKFMSDEAKRGTSVKAAEIKGILAQSSGYRETLSQRLKTQLKATIQMRQQANQTVNSLINRIHEVITASQSVSQTANSIQQASDQLLPSIKFNEKINQRLKLHIAEQERILEELRKRIHHMSDEDLEKIDLSSIAGRYTMMRERSVHQHSLGFQQVTEQKAPHQTASSEDSHFELFSNVPQKVSSPATGKPEDGNVELFAPASEADDNVELFGPASEADDNVELFAPASEADDNVELFAPTGNEPDGNVALFEPSVHDTGAEPEHRSSEEGERIDAVSPADSTVASSQVEAPTDPLQESDPADTIQAYEDDILNDEQIDLHDDGKQITEELDENLREYAEQLAEEEDSQAKKRQTEEFGENVELF